MSEKEPSGASPDDTRIPQPAGATPGGPFPQGQPPAGTASSPSTPPYHYTLHFLIAAIKRASK